MESCLLPLFTFLLFLLMLIKTIKRPKPTNLPPSPWKLPLIGNLHQLVAGGSLTHHTLTDLAKKYGPIMYLQLGQVPTIVISSPEIAKELHTTHDLKFSNRAYFIFGKIMFYDSTDIVFSEYCTYWKQLRKICTTQLFSASRVQSFQPIREAEVSNLITAISSSQGSRINLSKMIFSLMYTITSRAAFGNKCKDQDRFISIVEESMKLAAGFSLSEAYPSIKGLELISRSTAKFKKLHQESDEILENIINEHREGKNGEGEANQRDLVDVLLDLQADCDLEAPLTDNNIKAVILDVFIGGTETSSTVIEWAISELLKNPKLMKEAQAEVQQFCDENGNADIQNLKLLRAIIKETMRLHPSLPLLLPRECRESCVVSGYEIPAKAKVIVNEWAIARDPRYWTEPERFYPERFLDSSVDFKGTHFEFIPFGAGRRICPGISFSQPNIELSLAKLLYHFDWKLPTAHRQEDLDMTECFGLTVRRKQHLCLMPTCYRASSVPT